MKLSIETAGNGLVYIEKVKARVTPYLIQKMHKAVALVEGAAKDLAPVDTGRLRSSIRGKVEERPEGVIGRVGTNVNYAPFVEYGTGLIGRQTAFAKGVSPPAWYQHGPQAGHFVPFSVAPGLQRWVRRKGLNIAASAGGIKVSGRAQPFLQPAYERNMQSVIRIFNSPAGKSPS